MKPVEIFGCAIAILMVVMLAAVMLDDLLGIQETESTSYNITNNALSDVDAVSGLSTALIYVVMGIVIIIFVGLLFKAKHPKF